MWTLLAIVIAVALDWLFGDPPRIPHIVVLIGKLISSLEALLRNSFPATPQSERRAGAILVAACCATMFIATLLVTIALGAIHPALKLVFEAFVCWQCLAMRSLKQAALEVKEALGKGLAQARDAVAQIVGRETADLTEAEVINAAVETVAENTNDGVVAPLLYMAIGGAPLAVLYKTINTLDSMVGYTTAPYTHFGTAAAKADDVASWIPARIAGLAMVAAAIPAGLSAYNAWRVFLRDRRNHKSPNSGYTEAACAGALGLQLGGAHMYFGTLIQKPTIGDALRRPMPQDIDRACDLMTWTSAITFLAFAIVRLIVVI